MSSEEISRSNDSKWHTFSEFWLISAPGNKTGEETYQKLHNLIKKNNAGYVFKFHIPELKVGTLDLLVGLSEELTKLDTYIESLVRKLVQYLCDVLEGERVKLIENLMINGIAPTAYISKFTWDEAKYSSKQPLRNITDAIAKNMTQSENELKTKSQSYNALKTNIQNIERKSTGSLMTRTLTDLVKKEHFILNSTYLTTLLVVVPSASKKDWLGKYETLTDMIAPESSTLVTEDSEHCLFTVTLFRKVVEEFKLKCRENKFVVRDFEYNEQEMEDGKKEIMKLNTDKAKQEGPLIRWLKTNFTETFSGWLHVKALRTFIESILRYGLPVNFQAMVIAPPKRNMKKIKELLNQHYLHLDASGTYDAKTEMDDIPGFTMSSVEYYPYVYFKINLDMFDMYKA
ncbi:hypothetical protein HELRODRAFT_156435 [Helobdella robusta]|uniref:V-type proton ATPase subunit C n=1 Tax=Helobdella robusta TaxID=6412 RepID=T1ELW6_HELRO|nr:hypothetical protein HELRODRAFT_156435 [Helobdella robusta]ESO09279.1 hypothetical protein HELRODRAFT_156435 [Helobdella robusta]